MINLWIFPESDFPDWCELVTSPQVSTYQEYLTLIAAVQADQERRGIEVRRVSLTVSEMRRRLTESGLPNTPDSRAKIIAEGE